MSLREEHNGYSHGRDSEGGRQPGRTHRRSAQQRVALFMPTLGGGGAERVMLTLARGFSVRGLAVDLVVSDARGELRDAIPEDVRLVDLDAHWHLDNVAPLARYLRAVQPDALLSALTEANCLAIRARAQAGLHAPIAVTEHSTLSLAAACPTEAGAARLPGLIRTHYPEAQAVVAVSSGVADDLAATAGLPRSRIDVIYNPVMADEVLARSRQPLRHPWFAAQEPPVVLAVGRLAPPKDFPTLVRAFARLRQKRPARLMILGEGAQRARLQQLVQDLGVSADVSLPGFVENPYRYMRRADVVVLSSRWEGLPTVLIEALACEARIVSTDCPSGPAEILEDGRWGTLVPVGDDRRLAAAMGRALHARSRPKRAFVRAGFFSARRAIEAYAHRLDLALSRAQQAAVASFNLDQVA